MPQKPVGFVPDGFEPDPPPTAQPAPAAAPAPERTWGDTARDVAVGFGKGAVRSVMGTVDAIGQSRILPGVNPGAATALAQRFTPEYTNTAQAVGGGLETAVELAPGVVGAARGVAGLARAGLQRYGPEIMRAGTSETSLLTQARQGAVRKLLGRAIEMAKDAPTAAPSPNAGGRLVPGVGKNVDTVIADALEELRAPTPPSKVTTPPAADLPAGYTPRATVPRSKPAAAAAPQSDTPKRAYFLKPEPAAAAPAPKRQPRELTLDDLPESWRSRVGDVAPPQGIKGEDYAKAAADVLSEQGVTAKDAILAVSRNPNLPPGVRLQLISALKRAGGIR